MNKIIYLIGLVFCVWIGYLAGKNKAAIPIERVIMNEILKIDTVVRTDTLFKEIISPKVIRETVVRVDTIKADTAINLIKREYLTEIVEDSIRGQIKAVVSGYNLSLDSLQYNFIIPTKEIYIDREIITERIKKQRCNFGIFIGPSYNVINRYVDLSVGVGFTFNPF